MKPLSCSELSTTECAKSTLPLSKHTEISNKPKESSYCHIRIDASESRNTEKLEDGNLLRPGRRTKIERNQHNYLPDVNRVLPKLSEFYRFRIIIPSFPETKLYRISPKTNRVLTEQIPTVSENSKRPWSCIVGLLCSNQNGGSFPGFSFYAENGK